MDSNKNLDLSRKAYPYDENLRVAYMLGLKEGYDQAMQDFLEKARTWFFSDLYKYLVNSKEISIDEISRHFKNYMQNKSEN